MVRRVNRHGASAMSVVVAVAAVLLLTAPTPALAAFLCDLVKANPAWKGFPAGCNCTDPCATPVGCYTLVDCKGGTFPYSLYLNMTNLVSLPESVAEFSQLTMAKIRGNRLPSIPAAFFSRATTLKYLIMDSNSLRYLPDSTKLLTNARTFDFRNNVLSRADYLPRLSSLLWLHLEYNRLCTLPPYWYNSTGVMYVGSTIALSDNMLNCSDPATTWQDKVAQCKPTSQSSPCSADVPGWTCDRSQYADGIWCDCGCGVEDPDCATITPLSELCAVDQVCYNATCVTPGWNTSRPECHLDMYGWDKKCSCSCGGLVDPDCLVAGTPLHPLACPWRKTASYCNVGTDACVYPWTCDDAKYTDTLCNCGCGLPDPACKSPNPDQVNDCGSENLTCYDGLCKTSPWTCPRRDYNDGKDCNCGCGMPDPDCAAPGPGQSSDCQDKSLVCKDGLCVSSPWVCERGLYGDGKCHCGCGMADVDCGPPNPAQVNNCSGYADHPNVTCVDGVCGTISWTCSRTAFADSTCDCGCGMPDPSCTKPNATQANDCPGGLTMCVDGTCSVPRAWSCDPKLYNDIEVCACLCADVCPGMMRSLVNQCVMPGFSCLYDGKACPACGNSHVEYPLEECDGGDHCATSGCRCLDPYGPTQPPSLNCGQSCGDGRRTPNEQCDGSKYCTNCTCTKGHPPLEATGGCSYCGDGVLDPSGTEMCERDDPWCFVEAEKCTCKEGHPLSSNGRCSFCGNGVVENSRSEVCDSTRFCSNDSCTCLPDHPVVPGSRGLCAGCGNGIIEFGEECDGGEGCDGEHCKCGGGYKPNSPVSTWCVKSTLGVIIGAAVGGVIAIAIVVLAVVIIVVAASKRKRAETTLPPPTMLEMSQGARFAAAGLESAALSDPSSGLMNPIDMAVMGPFVMGMPMSGLGSTIPYVDTTGSGFVPSPGDTANQPQSSAASDADVASGQVGVNNAFFTSRPMSRGSMVVPLPAPFISSPPPPVPS